MLLMKNRGLILLLTLVALLAPAQAQEKGQVIRLDSALDEIVPPDAKLDEVAGNLVHLEGPVWVRQGGYLLFSDMDANVIHKWNPADGKTSVFLENSGFVTQPDDGQSGAPAEGGSNGITVDPRGRIVF